MKAALLKVKFVLVEPGHLGRLPPVEPSLPLPALLP